jgi:hypothetical protein
MNIVEKILDPEISALASDERLALQDEVANKLKVSLSVEITESQFLTMEWLYYVSIYNVQYDLFMATCELQHTLLHSLDKLGVFNEVS